jgi:hypothetical protein
VQECLHWLLGSAVYFHPLDATVPGPEHAVLPEVGVEGSGLGGMSGYGSV